jgi:type IV pilus assembly protein PilM
MFKLSDLFPVPEFLRLKAAGIDVSDRSVKFIQFKKHGDFLRPVCFGERKLDEGIIESGEIKNGEKFYEIMYSVKNALETDYAVLSLPEEKGFLKLIKMPYMPEDRVRASVETQLEEIIPMPLAETVFDCEVVGVSSKKDEMLVSIAAFPKNILGDYLDVFHKAGITPVSLELESHALVRAVVPKSPAGTCLVIDFGKTRTSLVVVSGMTPEFTSTISVAGDSITLALARFLKKDLFEAERVKKNMTLTKHENDKLSSVIMPVVSAIKAEIERVIVYWQTHHAVSSDISKKDIVGIILAGGDSNMPGLAEYLAHELKKPVESANVWSNAFPFSDYIPEISKNESLSYATAVGLALKPFSEK